MKIAFCVIVAAVLSIACLGDGPKVYGSSCAGEKAKSACSGPTLAKATKRVVDRTKQAAKKVVSVLKRDCSGS